MLLHTPGLLDRFAQVSFAFLNLTGQRLRAKLTAMSHLGFEEPHFAAELSVLLPEPPTSSTLRCIQLPTAYWMPCSAPPRQILGSCDWQWTRPEAAEARRSDPQPSASRSSSLPVTSWADPNKMRSYEIHLQRLPNLRQEAIRLLQQHQPLLNAVQAQEINSMAFSCGSFIFGKTRW